MGRGRTSTGMIAGSIIASIDEAADAAQLGADKKEESEDADFSEEAAYMNGMFPLLKA